MRPLQRNRRFKELRWILVMSVALVSVNECFLGTRELQSFDGSSHQESAVDAAYASQLLNSSGIVIAASSTGFKESGDHKQDDIDDDERNFPNPVSIAKSDDIIIQPPPPKLGRHRSNMDTIFCLARGYTTAVIARFVGSLIESGYSGDIVIGVSPWQEQQRPKRRREGKDLRQLLAFFAEYHNVVVYEINLDCKPRFPSVCSNARYFVNQTTREFLPDQRGLRDISQIRYEFYWAWSEHYERTTRIFISDARDVYFQQNPLEALDAREGDSVMENTMQVFYEDSNTLLRDQEWNAKWITRARGQEAMDKIGHNKIICSGTTVGGKTAMESYFRAMIHAYDETKCRMIGCDQGHHNYLIWSGQLLTLPSLQLKNDSNRKRIERIDHFEQGKGIVNTVGVFCSGLENRTSLQALGLLDSDKNMIKNIDGSYSSVLHQFDRCPELNDLIENKTQELLQQFETKIHLG